MPPFPIPAGFAVGVIQIASADIASGDAITTIGLNLTTHTVDEASTSLANHFGTDIWSPDGNVAYTFVQSIVRTATLESIHTVNLAGTQTGAPPPPNVALLVKKTSSVIGRKNRGRMYLCGILDEATIDGAGDIASGTMTTYNSQFDAFFAHLFSDGIEPAILHKDGSAPTEVTAFRPEGRVATQRHRLRP